MCLLLLFMILERDEVRPETHCSPSTDVLHSVTLMTQHFEHFDDSVRAGINFSVEC